MYGAILVGLAAVILGWLAFHAQETKPPPGVKRRGDDKGWYRRFSNYSHPGGPGHLNPDCPRCNSADYTRGTPCASCGFEQPWHEPPPFLSMENLVPILVLTAFVVLFVAVVLNRIFGFAPHF